MRVGICMCEMCIARNSVSLLFEPVFVCNKCSDMSMDV